MLRNVARHRSSLPGCDCHAEVSMFVLEILEASLKRAESHAGSTFGNIFVGKEIDTAVLLFSDSKYIVSIPILQFCDTN